MTTSTFAGWFPAIRLATPPPPPMSYRSGSQSCSWTPGPSVPTHETTGQDFYSLDAILSSHQRVPCRVEQSLYRLGFLNTNSSEEHLLPGTKLELPLWLARGLCSRRRQIISIQLPKQYRMTQRTILSADASVADLHRLGPYYYSAGAQLLAVEGEEERADLSRSLLETFLNRLPQIFDVSLNAYQSDTNSLTKSMDEVERHLYSLGQETVYQQKSWETGHGHIMQPSLLVKNSRKRKRLDSDLTDGKS